MTLLWANVLMTRDGHTRWPAHYPFLNTVPKHDKTPHPIEPPREISDFAAQYCLGCMEIL